MCFFLTLNNILFLSSSGRTLSFYINYRPVIVTDCGYKGFTRVAGGSFLLERAGERERGDKNVERERVQELVSSCCFPLRL